MIARMKQNNQRRKCPIYHLAKIDQQQQSMNPSGKDGQNPSPPKTTKNEANKVQAGYSSQHSRKSGKPEGPFFKTIPQMTGNPQLQEAGIVVNSQQIGAIQKKLTKREKQLQFQLQIERQRTKRRQIQIKHRQVQIKHQQVQIKHRQRLQAIEQQVLKKKGHDGLTNYLQLRGQTERRWYSGEKEELKWNKKWQEFSYKDRRILYRQLIQLSPTQRKQLKPEEIVKLRIYGNPQARVRFYNNHVRDKQPSQWWWLPQDIMDIVDEQGQKERKEKRPKRQSSEESIKETKIKNKIKKKHSCRRYERDQNDKKTQGYMAKKQVKGGNCSEDEN